MSPDQTRQFNQLLYALLDEVKGSGPIIRRFARMDDLRNYVSHLLAAKDAEIEALKQQLKDA